MSRAHLTACTLQPSATASVAATASRYKSKYTKRSPGSRRCDAPLNKQRHSELAGTRHGFSICHTASAGLNHGHLEDAAAVWAGAAGRSAADVSSAYHDTFLVEDNILQSAAVDIGHPVTPTTV